MTALTTYFPFLPDILPQEAGVPTERHFLDINSKSLTIC